MTGDYPSFDYERAWDELAAPSFDCLPANLRALYHRTCEVAAELHQLPDLSMPWPNEDTNPDAIGFRNAFREIPAEELSHAARVVYFYGHWFWRHGEVAHDRTGGHWKFAHYADQELRERLNVRAGMPQGNGIAVRIIEGTLRVCFSSPDAWSWHEVGAATERNLERTRHVVAMMLTPAESQRRNRRAWDKCQDEFDNLSKLAEWLCMDERTARWLHAGEQFKCMNSEITKRHDERREAKRAAEEARKEAEWRAVCAL